MQHVPHPGTSPVRFTRVRAGALVAGPGLVIVAAHRPGVFAARLAALTTAAYSKRAKLESRPPGPWWGWAYENRAKRESARKAASHAVSGRPGNFIILPNM